MLKVPTPAFSNLGKVYNKSSINWPLLLTVKSFAFLLWSLSQRM